MKKKIANLPFELLGDGEVYDFILKELSGYPNTQDRPEIIFNITERDLKIPQDITSISDIVYNGQYFALTKNKLNFEIIGKIFEDHSLKVNVQPVFKKKHKLEIYQRFKDWNFLTVKETYAKNFMYNIFDFIIELKLLVHNSSFIHASSFEKQGKAILFMAPGGVGKTSVILQTLKKGDWKYLADDFSIIDGEGLVYYNPKYIQIYPYNVKNDKKLFKMLMKGRGFVVDRVNWFYRKIRYGEKKVRRRVDPKSFFGKEKVGSNAQINKVVSLVRTNVKKFGISEIAPHTIADLASETLAFEINPFFKYSCLCNGGGFDSPLPKIEEVKARSRGIFQKVFEKGQCYQLRIPLKASPLELHEYIEKTLYTSIW